MFSGKRPSSPNLTVPWINIVSTSKGLTLLELIIAFVVLQVAIVAFAQLFTAGLDLSRRARRTEMAQALAQAKMEELIRTIPAGTAIGFSIEEAGGPQLLNERPGTFADFAYAHSEDIEPFMWVAETAPSADNAELLNVTLHVYIVQKRIKSKEESVTEEEFYVSEGGDWFTFIPTAGEGAVEVVHGKEKLRVSSAVALPR